MTLLKDTYCLCALAFGLYIGSSYVNQYVEQVFKVLVSLKQLEVIKFTVHKCDCIVLLFLEKLLD